MSEHHGQQNYTNMATRVHHQHHPPSSPLFLSLQSMKVTDPTDPSTLHSHPVNVPLSPNPSAGMNYLEAPGPPAFVSQASFSAFNSSFTPPGTPLLISGGSMSSMYNITTSSIKTSSSSSVVASTSSSLSSSSAVSSSGSSVLLEIFNPLHNFEARFLWFYLKLFSFLCLSDRFSFCCSSLPSFQFFYSEFSWSLFSSIDFSALPPSSLTDYRLALFFAKKALRFPFEIHLPFSSHLTSHALLFLSLTNGKAFRSSESAANCYGLNLEGCGKWLDDDAVQKFMAIVGNDAIINKVQKEIVQGSIMKNENTLKESLAKIVSEISSPLWLLGSPTAIYSSTASSSSTSLSSTPSSRSISLSLRWLNLSGNSRLSSRCLAHLISNCPHLCFLSLNGIRGADDHLFLSSSLCRLPLEGLYLNGCSQLSDAGLAAFLSPQAVIHHTLRILQLGYCGKVTDAVMVKLIERCNRLEELNFYSCQGLTDATLLAVGRCLKSTLRVLDCSWIRALTDRAFQQFLLNSQSQFTNLQVVNFCRCDGLLGLSAAPAAHSFSLSASASSSAANSSSTSSSSSAAAFQLFLSLTPKLIFLGLYGLEFTARELDSMLAETKKRNPKLRKIDVGGSAAITSIQFQQLVRKYPALADDG